ncbi:MAG TPA: sialidase family protein [Polyangia bacterium]|nr:sialidase family protein [Polyangia bacterium]
MGLLAAVAVLLSAGAARADGAFPDSLGVLTPEQLPDETLLATNFGLVMSFDRDQTWVWACEQGANSFAILYQMGPPPLNRIYAVSPTNLIYTDDRSCTWTASAPGTFDAFVDPTNANRVLAVVATTLDAGGSIYSVVESSDAGATFPQIRYTAAAGDHITGVEIARSNPQTVYLTLTSGTAYTPKVAVTTNGGTSWTLHDLSATLPPQTYSIRLVGIDPANPQKLIFRTGSSAGEALSISSDGGVSVTTPLSFPGGAFTAFARMASGSLVAGGVVGATDVAYRSTDNGATFPQLPAVPFTFKGLSARGTKLYAATENMVDPYAIMTSVDEGMTWQPLMAFDQNIQAIATCLQQYCQTDCDNRSSMDLFPDAVCTATVMPSPIDGGQDASLPKHDAGQPAHDAGTPARDAATGAGSGSGGCHCDLAPGAAGRSGTGVWGLLLAVAVLRPRRRRR